MTPAVPDVAGGAQSARAVVALLAAAMLLVALAAAVSVDVLRAAAKVKSDEATYVAMALSVAHDGDLTYEKRDLERFWGIYQQGPEGIFLKKGKRLRIRADLTPPFVHVTKLSDRVNDRLYYGKSMAYSLVAAPFVWMFGLNGFYVLHVLLLAAACLCGYLFLQATSEPGPAFAWTLAFVALSVVPVYGIFLMPDLFNFVLAFVAYFFWLYKEVAEPRSGFLRGARSDVIAMLLLAAATYSKPTNIPLVGPVVLLMLYRRRWRDAVMTTAVFGVAVAAWFGANAAVTGEFNYQGGDRKTFYGSFPFESAARDTWAEKRDLSSTNDADTANVFEPSELASRVVQNVEYFLVGRHFGFIPYYFPGVVAILAWLASRERFSPWRIFVFLGVAGAVLVLLLFLPYTWSGGGGPPGNRYFVGIYPALFFLLPRAVSWQALLACAGGALFTAKILVNPFVAAKNTWEIAERGFARRLPVELTMANDLPVMLAQPPRGHIPYHNGRDMLLYFLDTHAFPPEPVGKDAAGATIWGMWVSGSGRAEVIVRTDYPVTALQVEAVSPVRTSLTVSLGAEPVGITLEPMKTATFNVPASGVRGWRDYNYLMKVRSTDGFVPRLGDPNSNDFRNLGAQLKFQPIVR